MEKKSVYCPVLILTSCGQIQEINVHFDFFLNEGVYDSHTVYIPAQSFSYLIVSVCPPLKPDDENPIEGAPYFSPIDTIKDSLNRIEFQVVDDGFDVFSCCTKIDCSLYRKSDMLYTLPLHIIM